MTQLDLGPAAQTIAELVRNVRDDQLTAPTPCTAYTVGDLLDHIGGLTVAFTMAAAKATDSSGPPPPGDASRLADDWRTRIPTDLDALVTAWEDPDAWSGMTAAGGIEMPGEIAGMVAAEELVVHGWDLARATGQPYAPDPEAVRAAHGFLAQFSGPGHEADRGDAYGPVVAVPDDAPELAQAIGMSGRDPGWSPSESPS